MASLRDQIKAIIDFRTPNPASDFFSLIDSYQLTAAEIAAGVTPSNFTYAPGDVRRYGADATGVLDSAAAFAQAFLVKGLVSVIGNYKIGTPLTMDISTTTLQGPGQMTSTLTANAGAVIKCIASGGAESNSFHTITQIDFNGPGMGVVGVLALDFNTPSGNADCFPVTNCTIVSFDTAIKITNIAWEMEISALTITQCVTGIYSHFAGSERTGISNSHISNCTTAVLIDGGGGLNIANSSLDYCTVLVKAVNGSVYLDNCYFENNLDTDYWFQTPSANAARILLSQCHINCTKATAKALEWAVSASVYGGGIRFIGCVFDREVAGIVVEPFRVVAGTGLAFGWKNLVTGYANNIEAPALISLASNLCSNGTFANGAGGLGGWTVGSSGAGGSPTVTPANTLRYQVAVNGTDQFAYWTLNNVEPGDNVGFQCDVKTNVAAGAIFNLQVFAIGADGVIIANSPVVNFVNFWDGAGVVLPTFFTTFHSNLLSLPAGTAQVKVQMYTGAVATTTQISVQNVFIGKY